MKYIEEGLETGGGGGNGRKDKTKKNKPREELAAFQKGLGGRVTTASCLVHLRRLLVNSGSGRSCNYCQLSCTRQEVTG